MQISIFALKKIEKLYKNSSETNTFFKKSLYFLKNWEKYEIEFFSNCFYKSAPIFLRLPNNYLLDVHESK